LFPPGSLRRVGGGGGGDWIGGGLAITDSEKNIAVNIVYSATDDVGALILRQAEDRLKALQTAAHALDQRVTQVAALQFAAAAIAGSATAAGPLAALGGLSSLVFLVGGVVAFRGIRSDPIHLPGIAPNWWEASLNVPSFGMDLAQGWAAGVYQTAITEVDNENCERARHLNLSLRYALGGASLLAFAAVLRSFSS
jgi:hypothetical protein